MTGSMAENQSTTSTGTEGFTTGTYLRVAGVVQGVNFRNSTKKEADELSLSGWVRNTDDGAVEVLIAGEGPAVDRLVRWCGKGPRRAEVDDVSSRDATPEELATLPGEGFTVLR